MNQNKNQVENCNVVYNQIQATYNFQSPIQEDLLAINF